MLEGPSTGPMPGALEHGGTMNVRHIFCGVERRGLLVLGVHVGVGRHWHREEQEGHREEQEGVVGVGR